MPTTIIAQTFLGSWNFQTFKLLWLVDVRKMAVRKNRNIPDCYSTKLSLCDWNHLLLFRKVCDGEVLSKFVVFKFINKYFVCVTIIDNSAANIFCSGLILGWQKLPLETFSAAHEFSADRNYHSKLSSVKNFCHARILSWKTSSLILSSVETFSVTREFSANRNFHVEYFSHSKLSRVQTFLIPNFHR